MQLKNKLKLTSLVLTTLVSPIILNAATSSEVSFKQMKYQENDDRIKIDYSVLDIKKEFGLDYSLSVSMSYDTISGGTPIWDSLSGASSVENSDSTSGASSCIDSQSGKYLCRDTRSEDILGDGKVNMDDFKYKNVQINDVRKAISASLTKRTASRDEITIGSAYSKEGDFKSVEASFSYLYNLDSSRNRSISAGISYQKNDAYYYLDNKWKDFNIVNIQVGYSHVYSKYTVAQISLFAVRQKGELSNPYQTIIRKFDVSKTSNANYKYYRAKEKRPKEKNSIGLVTAFVSKVHKNLSLHGSYRIYKDDWGLLSNTLSTNAYIKLSPKFTLIPLIRFYKQNEVVFFKDHKDKDFTFNEKDYGTADERLGAYYGLTYNLGLEYKINNKLKADVHNAYQKQSFGLELNWASIGLNYEF